MDEIRRKENEATRLIQEERFDEAVAILEEVLRHDINNANAWWLIANAVDSPEEAREALSMVLQINPNHAKARQMFDRLNALYPAPAQPTPPEAASTAVAEATEPLPQAAEPAGEAAVEPAEDLFAFPTEEAAGEPAEDLFDFPAESPAAVLSEENPFDFETSPFDRPEEAPTTLEELGSAPAGKPSAELDETFFDFDEADAMFAERAAGEEEPLFDVGEAAPTQDFEFDVEEGEPPRRGSRRLLVFLLALLVIVVVSAAVALFVLNQGGGGPAATPAPTADTALAALNENHAPVLAQTGSALSAAGLQETAAAFRETSAGPGMVGVFCWAGGPGFADAAVEAMGIVTEQAQAIPEGLEAVGVELVRCDQLADVLYSAVTTLSQATDFYINGDSDEADFRATWVPGA